MLIQVLGPGCANCKQLFKNVQEALIKFDIDADIEKVEDIQQIMKFGVFATPAVVIDGAVKSSGRVLSVAELGKMLK